MKTDRELMELAAKAAGFQIDQRSSFMTWRDSQKLALNNPQGGHTLWNPLTDDGDALRLAVAKKVLRCHMDLFHRFYEEEMEAGREALEATRRAFVRAVVEIVEAMP